MAAIAGALFRWVALIAIVVSSAGARATPIQASGADRSLPGLVGPRPSRSAPANDLSHTRFRRSGPAASDELTGTVGDVTLHVPRGYIDGADGYQQAFDYVHLHALLPCLLPETEANQAEFHKNTIGPVMTLILSRWDDHDLTGQPLLDMLKEPSNETRFISQNDGF